jgi:histidinol dehydrogenase
MTDTLHFGFLTPERHQRGEDAASIIYPVVSRRARGLSLGINLFLDSKHCTYNCPYCEVQPFSNPQARLSEGMIETALRAFFDREWPAYAKSFALKDISISGNGEPTCSPFLEEALYAVAKVLSEQVSRDAEFSHVPIVLITNSTGFLNPRICEILHRFSKQARFEIWAKLDGGTSELHSILSGSNYSFDRIIEGIAHFAAVTPVKIQTMICRDASSGRLLFDAERYCSVLKNLIEKGAHISAIQLYTTARPPAEPWVASIDDKEMAMLASIVRRLLPSDIRLECFGRSGELSIPNSGPDQWPR